MNKSAKIPNWVVPAIAGAMVVAPFAAADIMSGRRLESAVRKKLGKNRTQDPWRQKT